MVLRRIELVCGVLGGALGFIALGITLFAPVWGRFCNPDFGPGPSSCNPYVTGVQNAVEFGQAGPVLYYILWIAVPSLGIVLFALWHGRTRRLPALVLLWVCTVLLGLQTAYAITAILAPLDVGGFLVPACVLAVGASIVGTVAAGQRVPSHVQLRG